MKGFFDEDLNEARTLTLKLNVTIFSHMAEQKIKEVMHVAHFARTPQRMRDEGVRIFSNFLTLQGLITKK